MKKYKDTLLESLHQVYQGNPSDLGFKKYFALELYKKGELKDAFGLLMEVFELDKDLNVERAINDIKEKLAPKDRPIGFAVDTEIEPVEPKKKPAINFNNVAGMDPVKEAIRTDIIYPFQHPEVYAKYNKQAGGGILLFGPPGCGKTFIAKATAGEIEADFISLAIHELISPFSGEGERILHEQFEKARENAPTVLFFDEIDAIGMSRAKTQGVLRTLVNQFLTELDGLGSDNEDVLVIGATNLPWEVDAALRRPGRFDKVLFVPPPDKAARARMFELNMAGKPHEDINYQQLAETTKQYSAADIVRICDESSEVAFKQAIKSGKDEKITQALLEASRESVKSSVIDWFDTAKNYIAYSNESGQFDSVKEYLGQLKHD